MQKLSPSVSEATTPGPASPDTPLSTPSQQHATTETSEPAVTAPLNPFDWPPPEEDLADWHVFQFDDSTVTAASPAPAAAPAPAPEPAALKPSQTPTLKIVSPFGDKPSSAAPPLTLVDTTPIASPFAAPATAPIGAPPQPAPATFATPETAPMAAPVVVPFATPETAPMSAPPAAAPVRPSTANMSIGLTGGMSESTLPARRVQTVAPVPVDPPLKAATVEVLARSAHAQPARAPRSSLIWIGRMLVIILALLAVGEAAYIATMSLRAPAAVPLTAAVFVQSEPAGAEILIDGQVRGKTPMRLDLPPGEHRLELRKDRLVRKLPLVLAAGTQVSHYVELHAGESESAPTPAPASPANTTTTPRPATPATVPSGDNAAAAPPPVRPAPTVGWLVVHSPVTLSILRNGEAIGNSDDGRLTIGAGRHELELSNSTAGYREAMAIQVIAGRETVLQPGLPQSTLDVESTPRARVSVDGRDVGETPLNQLALTIGPHEIVFRHPDFPDRTVSTFIRVGIPARVAVDLSNP